MWTNCIDPLRFRWPLSRLSFMLGLTLFAGCDDRAKEWTAWVYKDKGLQTYETLQGFKTFDQCQQAAIDKLRTYTDPDAGDYECGYMCRWDARWQSNICKETRK